MGEKWEYCRLSELRNVDMSGWPVTLKVESGGQTVEEPGTSAIDALNRLGAVGWEVVSIETQNGVFRGPPGPQTTSNWYQRRYLLKRRVAS